MFLRRIRIRNVRSIGSLDISFTGPNGRPRAWTYLLGENGLGKSTVLRSIALVLAGGEAQAELVGNPDDWIRLKHSEAEIIADFSTAKGESRRTSVKFERGSGTLAFLHSNTTAREQLDAALAKAERNYFVAGYGVTRRPYSSPLSSRVIEQQSYRARRARALASLFSNDATLVSIESWAMDLDYRKPNLGLDIVRRAFDTLLQDVNFSGINRDRRQLEFQTADGVLPLGALSEGYQAMAAWCGDLLFQITETFGDHKDPLKTRGLLLVDELDLHLHPNWQRRLVQFLKRTFPQMQVVASTHSPLTVHQANENELHILRRKPDGVTADVYEGAPNKLLLHQLIQSPVFGLETLDSPQVAEVRDELRVLQRIGQRDAPGPVDRKKIASLSKGLASAASWSNVPPYLEHTNSILEKIARNLVDDPTDNNPLGTVVERSTKKLKKTND